MTSSNSREGKLSEILAELKAEYRHNFPRRLASLRGHFERGDFDALREEFHKLKGTGKTYGFPEVSVLCELMEHVCAEGLADKATVERALGVLGRMETSWAEGRNFDLQKDPEGQSLLALGKGTNT